MTKRKADDVHQRPRRRLGEELRAVLRCPLVGCRGYLEEGYLEVVAHRHRTTRFECRECGLRFSTRSLDVAGAIQRRADERSNPEGERRLAIDIAWLSLLRAGQTPEQREELLERFKEGIARRAKP